MLCLLVIDFVCQKRDAQFEKNEFHFRHLGKDLSRARSVTTGLINKDFSPVGFDV